MDKVTQRRIVAILGMLIAFGGLTALIWGIMKKDGTIQLIGFFSILIAYIFTVIVKKMKEKEMAEKAGEQGSKLE